MSQRSLSDPKVDELSPDGYSRFYFLVDIIKRAFGVDSKPITILDVGGGSEYFEQQLNKVGIPYELTVIDIIERPKNLNKRTKFIHADATKMPFNDNAYDVVVSTDVLEHVYPERKKAFVEECVRVAKELLVVAAPFNTLGVNEAEIAVNEFNKKLFGVGQDWLEEHLELGKPDISMVESVLKAQKVAYEQLGTCNLNIWLLNTHLNLIDAKLGLSTKKHREINRFYNENIENMGETEGVTYRHFFVGYLNPKLRTKIQLDGYRKQKFDHEKSTQYMSNLMSLVADRLISVKKLQDKTTKALNDSQNKIQELERINTEQRNLLDKLSPLIKIARSKPFKVARKTVIKRKESG